MEEVVGKSKKDDTEIGGRHIEPCLGFTARMDTNLKVCGWHSSRTKQKVKTHYTNKMTQTIGNNWPFLSRITQHVGRRMPQNQTPNTYPTDTIQKHLEQRVIHEQTHQLVTHKPKTITEGCYRASSKDWSSSWSGGFRGPRRVCDGSPWVQ